jgi:hypothetical protein
MSALKGEVRLAAGWTRKRLVTELKRKVSNEVRRLHKLKEAAATRSEWEVLKPDANGEVRSVFDLMRGKRAAGPPNEALVPDRDKERKEAELMIAEKLQGGDEEVEKMFSCLREGIVKRREIAAKLGIDVDEVTNCRKRLDRKLDELGKAGCAQRVIEEWKKK